MSTAKRKTKDQGTQPEPQERVDPVALSRYFWLWSCSFYRLLYQSIKNNLPLTIQFGRVNRQDVQTVVTIQRKDTPPLVLAESFRNEGGYLNWERTITKNIEKLAEGEKNPASIEVEEVVMFLSLFQELCCRIETLFYQTNRFDLPAYYKFQKEGQGIRMTIYLNSEMNHTYTRVVKTSTDIDDFEAGATFLLRRLLNMWEDE